MEPEPTLSDGIRICNSFEEFAGHGHVGEIKEIEVAPALGRRVGVHVGDGGGSLHPSPVCCKKKKKNREAGFEAVRRGEGGRERKNRHATN